MSRPPALGGLPPPRESFTPTLPQLAHVHELRRVGCDVELVGVDSRDRPVIRRRDRNGWQQYAIRATGAGRQETPPVRPLTEDDDLLEATC